MATIQTINIGNIVNDGLGDDLRTAFQKVNANFATLNNDLTITASNLGTVGEPVFKQKSGVNLEFKKLVAGNKITISSSPDSLLISSTIGIANNHSKFRYNRIGNRIHHFGSVFDDSAML